MGWGWACKGVGVWTNNRLGGEGCGEGVGVVDGGSSLEMGFYCKHL